MPHPKTHARGKGSAGAAGAGQQWPSEILVPRQGAVKGKQEHEQEVLKPCPVALTPLSPVWVPVDSQAVRHAAKRAKKTESENPSYVGKWFARGLTDTRNEALDAAEWARR